MTGLFKDFRYAGRMVFKNPGLSVVAVTALGLGIGLTAVMFSIVYGALMRGLPFEGGDRIVNVARANPERDIENMGVTIHDYTEWVEQQSTFEGLAGYYQGTVNLRWTDRPERFDGAFMTANTFDVLGVRPVVGRTFREDETGPGAPMRVILAYHVWQDRFEGDPGVIGQALSANGEPAEIIGVMPEGFRFPVLQDLWVPLRLDAVQLERGTGMTLEVAGKLREGVSADQAMVEMSGISLRLAAAYPDTNEGVVPVIRPFVDAYIGDEARPLLWTMLAAVALVLLIACANVANLLLARAAMRTREMGIRTAMGADRHRIIIQMVGEAMALALVGALLGAGVAWAGIEMFARAVQVSEPPYWLVFKLDGPILLFIIALAGFSAVISGTIPAVKATATDVASILRDESRGSSGMRIGRLSRVLVIGEIAMSVGLLAAAGLMTKSIVQLKNRDWAYATDDVFTARVGLFETTFPDTTSRLAFFEDVRRRLLGIPGVGQVALTNGLPGTGSGGGAIAIEGESYAEERDHPFSRMTLVTPGFFDVFDVQLVQGRDFNDLDDADGLPVAIVNESFAATHFPEGALGRRLRRGGAESTEPWLTVVGVVPDLDMQGVGNTEGEHRGFYVPLAQHDARFMSLAARGPSDPMSITAQVRDAVAAANPDTPIYWVDTLTGRLAQNTWVYNTFGTLFMVFGVVALFLASVGLYAVMAFSVSRRTTEVGIRMALGAEGGQVLRMVLKQGLVQIVAGLVLGLGLAVVLARGLVLLLFEVSPTDPTVFGTIVGVLTAVGLVASLVPARRATRVDPMVALRYG